MTEEEYKTVSAGEADKTLGAGAAGDWLQRLVCVVENSFSAVQIKDGDEEAIPVMPNNVDGGAGTYVIDLGMKAVSKGNAPGWKITTGTGVSVIAFGKFT